MLLLCPLIFAAARLIHKRFEEMAVVVVFILALGTYLTGLMGNLRISVFITWFLWISAVIYLFYHWVLKKKFLLADFTIGFWAFILLGAILWWVSRGRLFTDWDEFSHWYRSLCNMMKLNSLHAVSASNDLFKEYPPLVGVWQYLICQTGFFGLREDVALFAKNVLTLSMLVFPLRTYNTKKQLPWAAVTIIVLFLSTGAYTANYYTTGLVDALLGVMLAFVLLVWFTEPNPDKFTVMLVSIGCAVLTLSKSSGVGLAAIAVILILLDVLFSKHLQLAVRFRVVAAVIPVISVIIAKYSWQIYLMLIKADIHWSKSSFTVTQLIRTLMGNSSVQYRSDVLRQFQIVFFRAADFGNMVKYPPIWIFVGSLLLVVLLIIFTPKKQRLSIEIGGIGLLLSGLVYSVSLLITYLFVFSVEEASYLASFARYMSTICTAILFFTLGVITMTFSNTKGRRQVLVFLGTSALLFGFVSNFAVFFNILLYAPGNAAGTQRERLPVNIAVERLKPVEEQLDKTWFVAQGDNGQARMKVECLMAPMVFKGSTATISANESGENSQLEIISAQQWSELLERDFAYVYIYQKDDAFEQSYKSLFADQTIVEGQLYRVQTNNEILLVPVS